jgi:uncharacterized membrane protein YebE (DUF533 family)
MRDAKALLDQVDLSSGTGSQGVQTQGDQQSAPSSGLNLEGLLSGRGGLATGAVAGGLAGLLLGGKRGRRLAGGALKVGGAALIGGLAYKAYQDYQAGKALSVSPSASGTAPVGDPVAALPIKDAARTDFMPSDHNAQEKLSQSLIVTIEGDQRAFIEAELAKPLDVGAIADMASTEEQRVEIYAASLIAVDPQGPAEKGYLAMLAARLGLDPKLVDHLHANADQLLV